jgi:hypothetical protein
MNISKEEIKAKKINNYIITTNHKALKRPDENEKYCIMNEKQIDYNMDDILEMDKQRKKKLVEQRQKMFSLYSSYTGPLYKHPLFEYMTGEEHDSYIYRQDYYEHYDIYKYI